MIKFSNSYRMIIDEIVMALDMIDDNVVDDFIELLLNSERVFFVGVGRVELMLHAFVKRLNHLGVKATYVGAMDEPAITDKDVLIVGSGSGESAIPVAIARIAKKYNAKIIHIGSNTDSSVSTIADLIIRIPCRTKFYTIIRRKGLDLKELWRAHANLE